MELVLGYAGIVKSRQDKGVTLMEMTIAIAVVGILLVVSILGFREQLGKGRDARRKEDIQSIKSAVEQYYDDFGCYPAPDKVVCAGTGLDPYIKEVPCDPMSGASYVYYYSDDQCNDYVVYARLERNVDPVVGSLGCSVGCGPDGFYNYYVASANYAVPKLTPTATPSPTQTTTPTVTPTPSTSPTVIPMCDGTCLAGECGACCPGANYRCTSDGQGCYLDATCTNP